jgi:hypothetical protein
MAARFTDGEPKDYDLGIMYFQLQIEYVTDESPTL